MRRAGHVHQITQDHLRHDDHFHDDDYHILVVSMAKIIKGWVAMMMIRNSDECHNRFVCWVRLKKRDQRRLCSRHLVSCNTFLVKCSYESFATVGEIRVWWRADFQSGSRVLKKVF